MTGDPFPMPDKAVQWATSIEAIVYPQDESEPTDGDDGPDKAVQL
jgi:hypothetical protein